MAATFIDLQVNGYAGVDFNADDLTDDAMHEACARLRADHVAAALVTLITDDVQAMARRARRIVGLRERDALVRDVVAGIHFEGPFISAASGYVGAHPAAWTRAATPEIAGALVDAADGVCRLVTLAPERDEGARTTRWLVDRGVAVAAGHTDASLAELDRAIDAGLGSFTHLGNGCPTRLARHDNIVQRALSRASRLWIGFIADGVHVPWFALGNYLRAAGLDRCFVVSDAIAAAGLGPGRYRFAGQDVVVGSDGAVRPADGGDWLVGSTATMPRIAASLRSELGLDASAVARLLHDNPRSVMRGAGGPA